MRLLRLLFRRTFNNVIFGIALMVLAALYIGIGSGVPAVREYFELNDLAFFNAWPLKLLMLLLCINLAVVTWNRIPLTPPRYGVWCIHLGIITLIIGMSLYYHFKVEGKTLIPLDHAVDCFYDSAERALYARVMNRPIYGMHPLPTLPEFSAYDADHDPDRLERADLTNISEFIPLTTADSQRNLAGWLGLSHAVHLDIVGFYPYADVAQNVVEDPGSDNVGVEVIVDSPHGQNGSSNIMLTAADPTAATQLFGNTELTTRQVSPESLDLIRQSAAQTLSLTVDLPGEPSRNIPVEVGQSYDVPGGYRLTIDSFDPAFPMFGTHEIVKAMTIHVVSSAPAPKREFWRMVLQGQAVQTDFKMDPATTPPMVKGNRQKTPIDQNLALALHYSDPASIMPTQGSDKFSFFTYGKEGLLSVHASFTAPIAVRDLSDGGQIDLAFDGNVAQAQVRRVNHFRVLTHVLTVPRAQRVKDIAESGAKQVVVVRVSCGDWSDQVCVPCSLYAVPDSMTQEPMSPWSSGVVQIPGASGPLQLQLGFLARPLPATLELRKFEMIHYPGGTGSQGPFRDFRSTLQISNPDGDRDLAIASLNEPVYYQGGKWIFFQAGYDPDGQDSTIGVGNRPGVYIMVTGCIMIVMGLMYAFYLKPIIIRRMKTAALARAKATMQAPRRARELVSADLN